RDRNVTGVQTCALPILAIVGERGDDDRPETLRSPRGDLERGETAPRDPHHAGPAGIPRLVGDPFEHVLGVLLLLLQILVHESAEIGRASGREREKSWEA